MKKPLIGVLPLTINSNDNKWDSLWMYPGYLNGIVAAGGIPVVLPLLDNTKDIAQLVDSCDGLLFPGGQDIDPSLYNEETNEHCEATYPPKDTMEAAAFKEAYRRDKPIFGVCRGLQLFNVMMGGSLYQNIQTQYPNTAIKHLQETDFAYPTHTIDIVPDSFLAEIAGTHTVRVNTRHHQAVKDIGEHILVTARAKDGIVEGIELTELTFGHAIQWHPEFLWDKRPLELNLFKAFVQASRAQA